MRYNTIVFDLDGTLLNTLEDLCDSVNVIMERFGWKTHSLEEIRRFVGNGIGKLMERATPEGRKNPQFEEAFEAFRAYYTDHCQIKTRAYDGVVDLMNELKENGAKLAIVSNKNDAAVKELNEIYFSGCVSAAIGEVEGRQRKPAPADCRNFWNECIVMDFPECDGDRNYCNCNYFPAGVSQCIGTAWAKIIFIY